MIKEGRRKKRKRRSKDQTDQKGRQISKIRMEETGRPEISEAEERRQVRVTCRSFELLHVSLVYCVLCS